MGLVLNTNIGAIQAQRALTESRQEMELAMERLSTGQRINSAADDAAGLAMVERMNSQIRGLTMATKNANDGIALIKTAENALVEVSGMLQRMRELAVQSANATNTATERAFADDEITQLKNEISRVSANTRYNGTQILNGTFTAKKLQLGIMSGEDIAFNIDSIEAALLGAYVVTSMARSPIATASAPPSNNTTGEDLTIVANGNTRTVDIEAGDSAKQVATKINAVAGATTVLAQARTFGLLSSSSATESAYILKINGEATASFTISSNAVGDAVSKINAISATTGVLASATTDNKVRLEDKDGDDITIENESTGTDLRIASIENDGVTDNTSIVQADTVSLLAAHQAATATNSTTGDTVTIDFGGETQVSYTVVTSGNTDAANNRIAVDATTSAFHTALGTILTAAGVNYSAAANATSSSNTDFTFGRAGGISAPLTVSVGGATALALTNITTPKEVALNASTGTGATTILGSVRLYSSSGFSATQTSGSFNYFSTAAADATAALSSVTSTSVATTIGATNALAVIDGALETVSSLRGSLGTLQNRLDYSVSNLMKVTEYTIGARSRVSDADFAAETSRLAKAQVLQQAGASMLAQANASTDVVLQVLRG
tara:strand:+ start:222 stop:2060 length:1839 start_codon:yes stop_codon:yes gene_type:complete